MSQSILYESSVKSTNSPLLAVPPRPQLKQFSALREVIDLIILIGAIYAFVNLTTARFIVDGRSMEPTFKEGQYLIVSRIHYLMEQPERGDIVVFHYPGNPNEDYIKRVIGVPGDVVAIRDATIYINGEPLDEPYINELCRDNRCPDTGDTPWVIGSDEVFVMGDNRNHSSDSRDFGPVEQKFIVGEVLIRYWPPSDWGIVSRSNYPDS